MLLNLDGTRKRLEHLRADPRVSRTVLDGVTMYPHIIIHGPVTITPDEGLAGLDRLATHYTGSPYPNRENPRFDAWLEIDSYHAWGY